jgi:hypothetical protein
VAAYANPIPPGLGTIPNADAAFFGETGRVYRRVDILNPDGSIWLADAPVLEGEISVDMGRDERRTFQMKLDNDGNLFRSDPDGFWYDKIVKIYRGVMSSDGTSQAYQLGEFVIDRISEPHFPREVTVTGRDYTKVMKLAKFARATAFTAGMPLEQVIGVIATNAGITKQNLPATGKILQRDFFFEAGLSRWEAAKQITDAYGYEMFFDQAGVIVIRPFVDPTTAPVQFTFFTGDGANLASYELSTNDTRVFNHVVVKGQASDSVPVYASVENNEVSSPTRIGRLGRRTYVYESKFVNTQTQADELGASLLSLMALESFELSMQALVAPWLEAGVAVQFIDPDPAPYAPVRFLLTDFSIPLALGTMEASARRVTIVG